MTLTPNFILLFVYVAYVIIMSIVAFAMYGKDKNMAKGGTAVRIKEKTLLSLACFGGALGAFIGRVVFHHKTNKVYFSMVILLSLFLQVATLAVLVYCAL